MHARKMFDRYSHLGFTGEMCEGGSNKRCARNLREKRKLDAHTERPGREIGMRRAGDLNFSIGKGVRGMLEGDEAGGEGIRKKNEDT